MTTSRGARAPTLILSILFPILIAPGSYGLIKPGFYGIAGNYCRDRRPEQCCRPANPDERDDECTMPILGNHLCYCDFFCDRRTRDPTDPGDCCPDFEEVCKGIVPSTEAPLGPCPDDQNRQRTVGERVQVNCKTCTCTRNGWEQCEPREHCLIDLELKDRHQRGRFSWSTSDYRDSWPWGRALSDGVTYRLGTLYPEDAVRQMHGILPPVVDGSLPQNFDARQKWRGWISDAMDQGDCGASWAFSTLSLGADRLAILSEGKVNLELSAQHLLSCNQHRQRGCDGGYLDRAWWYFRHLGVVSSECYPYESGRTRQPGQCQIPRSQFQRSQGVTCPNYGRNNKLYRITPPYRMEAKEDDIMKEIYVNGPVQATFRVYRDFYMYRDGVYKTMPEILNDPRSNSSSQSGYHSVKIIGWGVDYDSNPRGVKYWLCVNSWGPRWGSGGTFKIARGENHCEIESFVITALGKARQRRRVVRRQLVRRRRVI